MDRIMRQNLSIQSHRFENDLYKTGAECRAWGEEAWRKPQHWRTCRGGILHALMPGPLYALSSQLDNLHAHGVDGRTQPLPGLPPKLKHGVCPDCGRSMLPGSLYLCYQEQSSFRVPVQKDYANYCCSTAPKSHQQISILPLSPSTPTLPSLPSILLSFSHWPSTPLIRSSGHLLCFLSFVLLPSQVTGNHRTWASTSQSPCSVLISINYVLVLDFVSLEPTHPLLSQQSLALTNENLGFQIYFPWNELQEPILEKLNTDAFVLGWLLLPSPCGKGRPGLPWGQRELPARESTSNNIEQYGPVREEWQAAAEVGNCECRAALLSQLRGFL